MSSTQVPPNWWPDPFRRYELRYWDGAQWTHHVSTRGHATIDPPVAVPVVPHLQPPASATPDPQASTTGSAPVRAGRPDKKIQRQVARAGAFDDGRAGGGTLFTESVLVVNQRPKMIDVNAEYAVYDKEGARIGSVREIGQSVLRNVVSTRSAGSRARRLQVLDAHGSLVLLLHRPEKIARSTVVVREPTGAEVGQIVQKTLGLLGKVRFDLVVGGQSRGSIQADSWGVWDFSILDDGGSEIGRITKGRGLGGGQTSTKRDKYVVEVAAAAHGSLRVLVVAAALAVDTALRQHK